MSIYKSAYETTVGSAMVTKAIQQAIKEAIIRDNIQYRQLELITSKESSLCQIKYLSNNDHLLGLEYTPIYILGDHQSESNIPFFDHGMLVDGGKGRKYVAQDLRSFVRTSGKDLDEVLALGIRNRTEFHFSISRLVMELVWANGEYDSMRSSLSYAGIVFAGWLSETIAKRFALNPADQQVLNIIAHFYYQSLFFDRAEFDEEMKQRFAVQTMAATKASSQTVFSVFDKIDRMSDINDFCSTVKKVLENIRLEEFDVGLLITMIGNTWFGMNSKEILAVALEHPPTWTAIVLAAIDERTFKNSVIARIALRYAKGSIIKDYVTAYENLIESYLSRLSLEDLKFNDFN